jgi:hypothetical protein
MSYSELITGFLYSIDETDTTILTPFIIIICTILLRIFRKWVCSTESYRLACQIDSIENVSK